MLGFAGLYEFWPDPELPEDDPERWLLTCTVLTTTTQDAGGTSLRSHRNLIKALKTMSRFARWHHL
ncbi:hypothetical protein AAU01_13300 [Paenarthrobacter aurescens]|uniref:Uncharacterized protein n=1 Tax=Paenarthrobacter aurescens TaxID=43663 RepID=A0A4Y3NDS2_PAEAU|nr:hypothetical protein AAU01_13300 [Paenarthrobacter aurescens]